MSAMNLSEQPSVADQYAREELARAVRGVLSTAEGKRLLFWILEQCAIYQDAYCGENNATNYTLGLQAGGRKLISLLDSVEPRLYPQLLIDMATIKETDMAAVQALADREDYDE